MLKMSIDILDTEFVTILALNAVFANFFTVEKSA